MLRDSQRKDHKNVNREIKEKSDIAAEKVRTKDIKQLKTLDELMKEER